jgi:hypothetical protein
VSGDAVPLSVREIERVMCAPPTYSLGSTRARPRLDVQSVVAVVGAPYVQLLVNGSAVHRIASLRFATMPLLDDRANLPRGSCGRRRALGAA